MTSKNAEFGIVRQGPNKKPIESCYSLRYNLSTPKTLLVFKK